MYDFLKDLIMCWSSCLIKNMYDDAEVPTITYTYNSQLIIPKKNDIVYFMVNWRWNVKCNQSW